MKNNDTFWLIIGLGFFSFVLIMFFVVIPIATDIATKSNDIKNKDSEITNLINQQKADSLLYKNSDVVSNLYQKAETFLPKKTDSNDFIIQIEDISTKNDTSLTEITFAPEITKTNNKTTNSNQNIPQASLNKTGFTMTEIGSYQNFFKVIKNMESMGRMYSINQITINSSEKLLNIKINGFIYNKPIVTLSGATGAISKKETEKIENLIHYGDILSENSISKIFSGRADPFIPSN